MKPITYWVSTPAIQMMCNQFGSFWERLKDDDRYCIAWGLAEGLMVTAQNGKRKRLDLICTQDGHKFPNHSQTMKLLKQLDSELNGAEARHLAAGILLNGKR